MEPYLSIFKEKKNKTKKTHKKMGVGGNWNVSVSCISKLMKTTWLAIKIEIIWQINEINKNAIINYRAQQLNPRISEKM